MELQPSERCPGLQYLDDVDQGGVADLAGLCKGDYLVAVSTAPMISLLLLFNKIMRILGSFIHL